MLPPPLGIVSSIAERGIGIVSLTEERGLVQFLETFSVLSLSPSQFSRLEWVHFSVRPSVAAPTPVGVPATRRHGNLSFSSGCFVGHYVNYHVHYSASKRNGLSRFLLVVPMALLYVDYMYTIQCPDIVAIESVH